MNPGAATSHPARSLAGRVLRGGARAALARLATSPGAAAVALIAAVLPFLLSDLDAPILDAARFRQTQTAMSVESLARGHAGLLAYETPVFGPPWRVPFEFPIYQAVAALLVRAGVASVEAACRIASIAFFALSAGALFVLCRIAFGRGATPILALAAYLASPFGLYFARSATIESTAVFFSLAYAAGFVAFLERRRARLGFAVALVAGVGAYLVKPTTVLAVAVVVAFFVVRRARIERRVAARAGAGGAERVARGRWASLSAVAALVLVPLAAGAAWTAFADSVKAASPLTEWLTTENLTRWNFGRWTQKLNPKAWRLVGRRIAEWIAPGIALAFVAAGIVGAWRGRGRSRTFVLGSATAVVATIFVFFNLYRVHDYYLAAVAPYVAIAVGHGAAHAVALSSRLSSRWRIGVVLALVALSVASFAAAFPYVQAPATPSAEDVLAVAAIVRRVTPEDGYVAIAGDDWNPSILYCAGRRGLMVRGRARERAATERMLRTEPFTTVVCRGGATEILSHFAAADWVGRVGEIEVFVVRR